MTRGRGRRLRPLRAHAAAARQRRRDRRSRRSRSRAAAGSCAARTRWRRCSRSSKDRPSASATTAATSPRRRAGSSRTTRDSSRGSCSGVGGSRAAPPLVRPRRALRRPRSSSATRPATGCRTTRVSIARERFVGTGMQERIAVRNESMERARASSSRSRLAADFADIISVKLHDFSLGDPEHAQPLPPPAPPTYDEARRQLSIVRSARRPRHADRASRSRAASRANAMSSRLDARSARALGSRASTCCRRSSEATSRRVRAARRRARDPRRRRRRVDAPRPAGARRLGEPAPRVRPLDRRPRGAAHADGRDRGGRSSPPACRGS